MKEGRLLGTPRHGILYHPKGPPEFMKELFCSPISSNTTTFRRKIQVDGAILNQDLCKYRYRSQGTLSDPVSA